MLERGTLFSAFERSVDRRLSFLTLVVFLPSAVAFLVQTKFQTVSPGYDILDEPSDKAAASFAKATSTSAFCQQARLEMNEVARGGPGRGVDQN